MLGIQSLLGSCAAGVLGSLALEEVTRRNSHKKGHAACKHSMIKAAGQGLSAGVDAHLCLGRPCREIQ